MTAAVCIATESCQSRPAVGHLCAGHLDRLASMLREVEDEAALLSPLPSMQQRMDGGHGGLPSERAPARLEVLVHQDHRRGTGKSETDDDALAAGDTLPVLDVLHSWARLVREERDLTADGPATVMGERGLLTRHLEWIAEQDWVDEAYRDIRTLIGQLRAANGHRAERPHSACPVVLDSQSCTGSVWIRDELQPVWRRYTDRCAQTWEPAPGAAICDMCGASWVTAADKARLKRMIADAAQEAARPTTEDGRRMLTADELVAQGYATTRGNVRVIAHRNGLVSVDGHYDPDDFRERMSA